MGPAATTASGILVGLILFLATALLGVIAVNGANNPGVTRQAHASAAGGASAPAASVEDDSGWLPALDINGDGKLSLAEAAGNERIVTRFNRADRNRDGQLSKAEYQRLAKLPPPKAPKKKPRRPEATGSS